MPYNGSGVYEAPSNSFNPAVSATTISPTDWNTLLADIESALTNCVTKDNQTTITTNIKISTDGLTAPDFLRSNANDTASGDLTLSGAVDLTGTWLIGSTQVTSTAAELNILDGVTSTTAELNILDGVTSTAAELNILDGVTATTAELNRADLTAATGTVTAQEFLTTDASKDIGTFNNVTSNTFTGNLTGDVTGAHDGIRIDTFTGTTASIGSGVTTTFDLILSNVTTVYGGAIMLDTAAAIYAAGAAEVAMTDENDYSVVLNGGSDGYSGGTISAPSAGRVKVGVYNNSPGSVTYSYRIILFGV